MCALTGSGLPAGSRFAFQFVRGEFRALLTVSIAAFLVAGFLRASRAEVAAELTACDLAILVNKSGRDVKYLDTARSTAGSIDQWVSQLVKKTEKRIFLVGGQLREDHGLYRTQSCYVELLAADPIRSASASAMVTQGWAPKRLAGDRFDWQACTWLASFILAQLGSNGFTQNYVREFSVHGLTILDRTRSCL